MLVIFVREAHKKVNMTVEHYEVNIILAYVSMCQVWASVCSVSRPSLHCGGEQPSTCQRSFTAERERLRWTTEHGEKYTESTAETYIH